MSFIDCVLQNAALTQKEAASLVDEYNTLVKRYKETMGSGDAAASAARKIVEIEESKIVKKKVNTIRDIVRWGELQGQVQKYAALVQKQKDAAPFLKVVFGSPTNTAVRAVLQDAFVKHQAYKRAATVAIGETIEKYRPKNAGLTQDKEGFKKVVSSLLGKSANDAALDAEAKAIREVFTNLHKMLQNAGGILGRLDNYFPQSHNPNLVFKVGAAEWKQRILPLLDRNKMIDVDTGLPFTNEKLDKALDSVHTGIVRDGLDELKSKIEEGKVYSRGGGVAERHAQSRFLHFKDADSYLQYNREFGYGDDGLFDAMMGHIEAMTRDISILEALGPKPSTMVERLKLIVKSNGGTEQDMRVVQGMYDTLAGRNHFSGKQSIIVDALDATKNLLRAVHLGGAALSAIPDATTVMTTAKINGVPVREAMGQYLSLLNPADGNDRRIARRQVFIAGAASGKSLSSARMTDDMSRHGKTAWAANFTNNAGGLGAMTDAVKQAVPMSAMGFLAEAKAVKLKWQDLPPAMREAFDRWDMNEDDFGNMMRSELFVDAESGADFLTPEAIAKSGFGETARKYNNWLADMMLKASNEPNLLSQAITTGAVLGPAQKGTLLRETAGATMMFKSFMITSLTNHTLPYLRYALSTRKIDRLAMHFIGTTILGAAALQLGELTKGKQMKDMDNANYWGAAIMKGGGMSLMGDFLFSDASRYDYNIMNTLAGPMVGLGNDVNRLTIGNFDRMLDDNQEAKFFADFVQFGRKYNPVPGAKLWYTRLLFDRAVGDQIERMADPKFDKRMMRREQKMKKDWGQEYWWQPGEALPE